MSSYSSRNRARTAATRRRATAAASAAAKAARVAAAKAARAADGDFSWCGIRMSADFLADMDDDGIAALIEGEEQAEETEALMRSLSSRRYAANFGGDNGGDDDEPVPNLAHQSATAPSSLSLMVQALLTQAVLLR